jgi:uncharacterized SAM-binding protein YcdF (DUF218 family)
MIISTFVNLIINSLFYIIVLFFLISYIKKIYFINKFLILVLVIFTFTPLSQMLLKNLENYDPHKKISANSHTKILVLSGTSIFEEKAINYQTKMRIDAAMSLSEKYNINKIYYSGIGKYNNDIDKISKYFASFKTKKNTKIFYETNSRNTYQNLSFVKSKFNINNKDNSWILVTSAFHFKRVSKITDKLNWTHQNFKVNPMIVEINFFDFNNWQYLSIYLKEEIAIIYYKFKGYI